MHNQHHNNPHNYNGNGRVHQAHKDAVDAAALLAHKDAVSANPFTLKNVVVALFTASFLALIAGMWSNLQDGQKASQEALTAAVSELQKTHEVLIVHGILMTNLQQDLTTCKTDVKTLRDNCMSRQEVQDLIHAVYPETAPRSSSLTPAYPATLPNIPSVPTIHGITAPDISEP